LEDFAALPSATPGSLASELGGSPVAQPTVPRGGDPASPTIIAGIEGAIREQVACANTGDIRLITALWTDDYFRQTFGGADLTFVLEATPVPPNSPASMPEEIENVRVLPDGRVTAVTRTEVGTARAVFVEVGGRFLLDGIEELTENGTPEP